MRTFVFCLSVILMCPSVHSVCAQVDSVTVEKVSIINAKHKVESRSISDGAAFYSMTFP